LIRQFRSFGEQHSVRRPVVRLDDPEKVSAAADIETLRMQVAKPEPNRAIVREALTGIKDVAAAAGLVSRITGIAEQLRDCI